MKSFIYWTGVALALAAALALLSAQLESQETRLPSGRSQKEEILKAEHQKSLEDAAKLIELSEELKIELERNDRYVVSVSSIRKTEEIEKLAKRIRKRLKRY